jgi:hypothetical protein
MARKKLITEVKFYAYYNVSTGSVLSVTNEKSTIYKDCIEISYDMHNKLVSGKEKFNDYAVGYLKTDDDKTILSLIPRLGEAYSFKNTMFEVINGQVNKQTELTVEWNIDDKYWTFALSPEAKLRIGNSLSSSRIPFFIILESDFDFLIRTIIINCQDLLGRSKVAIPFENDLESHIDKITMATKLTFQSYGLKIND